MDGTPFYLNLHQRIQDGNGNSSDDVAHTFLTGRTGSGKSFFANFLTLVYRSTIRVPSFLIWAAAMKS